MPKAIAATAPKLAERYYMLITIGGYYSMRTQQEFERLHAERRLKRLRQATADLGLALTDRYSFLEASEERAESKYLTVRGAPLRSDPSASLLRKRRCERLPTSLTMARRHGTVGYVVPLSLRHDVRPHIGELGMTSCGDDHGVVASNWKRHAADAIRRSL